MSKIYHPDCKSLITSMYVKNGLIAILFLIASIFGVVVMREWKILLIGLMCAAYFIFKFMRFIMMKKMNGIRLLRELLYPMSPAKI